MSGACLARATPRRELDGPWKLSGNNDAFKGKLLTPYFLLDAEIILTREFLPFLVHFRTLSCLLAIGLPIVKVYVQLKGNSGAFGLNLWLRGVGLMVYLWRVRVFISYFEFMWCRIWKRLATSTICLSKQRWAPFSLTRRPPRSKLEHHSADIRISKRQDSPEIHTEFSLFEKNANTRVQNFIASIKKDVKLDLTFTETYIYNTATHYRIFSQEAWELQRKSNPCEVELVGSADRLHEANLICDLGASQTRKSSSPSIFDGLGMKNLFNNL